MSRLSILVQSSAICIESIIGESPDGDCDNVKKGFVEHAIERICKRIPGMDEGYRQSSNGGYDGITPDQRAILGPAGPEGYYLACGFSGIGFKIVPAAGESWRN